MRKNVVSKQVARYEISGVSTLSALEEARDFLRQVLARGFLLPVIKVRSLAGEAGIAPRTLERAKQQLPIKTVRRGVPGRRGGGEWAWYLDNRRGTNTTEGVVLAPPQSGAPTVNLPFAIQRASREFIRETKWVNSVLQRLTPFAAGDPSPADYRTLIDGDPLAGPMVLSLWAQLESLLSNRGEDIANETHSKTLALPARLPEQPSVFLLRMIQLNGVVISKLRRRGNPLGRFLIHTLEQIPPKAKGEWKYRKRWHKGWLEIRADPLPDRRIRRALSYLRNGASLPFTKEAMASAIPFDELTSEGVAAQLESKWFEKARSWLRWCRSGSHLYLADGRSQRDCHAHRNAMRQKQFRLTSKHTIGVPAPLASAQRT